MTVYEAVVLRLAMLGYEVTDNDKTGLEYLINKCEKDILANINQKVLPDGLFTRLWIWWLVTLCITKSRRCFGGL